MDKKIIRLAGGSCVLTITAIIPAARAQMPVEFPADQPACNRTGRLHRMFHHTAHTVQDKWIGYPENFIEPPLGAYIHEQFSVQVAKADPHRFTLYRTDFLPGTSSFSPIGASRYNIMAGRIAGWPGPITIEWTPEHPSIAEARRLAVVETLLKSGQPALAQRVVIGPSPYPGAVGIEAANNYTNTIIRSQTAAQGFLLPPAESASLGVR